MENGEIIITTIFFWATGCLPNIGSNVDEINYFQTYTPSFSNVTACDLFRFLLNNSSLKEDG